MRPPRGFFAQRRDQFSVFDVPAEGVEVDFASVEFDGRRAPKASCVIHDPERAHRGATSLNFRTKAQLFEKSHRAVEKGDRAAIGQSFGRADKNCLKARLREAYGGGESCKTRTDHENLCGVSLRAQTIEHC